MNTALYTAPHTALHTALYTALYAHCSTCTLSCIRPKALKQSRSFPVHALPRLTSISTLISLLALSGHSAKAAGSAINHSLKHSVNALMRYGSGVTFVLSVLFALVSMWLGAEFEVRSASGQKVGEDTDKEVSVSRCSQYSVQHV